MRVLLIIISLFLFSCKEEAVEKTEVMPREKFIELLVNMYRIEGKVSGQAMLDEKTDKKFRKEYLDLFTKSGTDSTEVRKAFESYNENPDELRAIMQEVFNRLGAGK